MNSRVDAICIVQDDVEDKAVEISKMSQIFARSQLTICSSRALTADEGFLHPRKPYKTGTLLYKLPYRLPYSNELGWVILSQDHEELSENRLSSRSWAFQERMMSRRILDFGGSATSVNYCQRAVHTRGRDGGPADHDRYWIRIDAFRSRDFRFADGTSAEEEKKDNDPRHIFSMEDWCSRVQVYTQGEITVPTDRILALASVAERKSAMMGATYLAGLWEEHLPWMLMWAMMDRDNRPPRPAIYQGPSWSWVAINGPVHFHFPETLREDDAEIRCSLLGHDIDLQLATAAYGAVKSASLVIQGKTRRARWIRGNEPVRGGDFDYLAYRHDDCPESLTQNSSPLPESSLTRMLSEHPEELLPARIYPDALELEFSLPLEDGGAEYLDVILLECFRSRGDLYGLALRDSDESGGVYTRVGVWASRKGQSYYYAKDERYQEVVGDEHIELSPERNNPDKSEAIVDSDNTADASPAADAVDNGFDITDAETVARLAEIRAIGAGLENQIAVDNTKRTKELQDEEGLERFVNWFDDDDCEESVVVLV